MRLLHTTDLTLRSFYGDIPKYAILSHTWAEDEEVSYKELVKRRSLMKTGWVKIQNFCKLVAGKGYDWCWIDTCCIDKSSSAELQEAINSMFKYYRDSSICIAYLADVPAAGSGYTGQEWATLFEASRWFKRAWTLQELLAPEAVHFWDREWTSEQGTKQSLVNLIFEATQINRPASIYFHRTRYYAVDILSWAAKRQCSRPEDEAYALMGLLNINIPLLYGEGSRALQRLQQEILDTNDDESVLVWKLPPSAPASARYAVRAPSILCFADFAREAPKLAPPRSKSEAVVACPLCYHAFLEHEDVHAHLDRCIDLNYTTVLRPLVLSSRGLHVRRRLIRAPKFEAGDDAFFVPLAILQDWRTVNRFLLRIRPMRTGNAKNRELPEEWPKASALNSAICCHARLYTTQELEDYELAPVANTEVEILILRDLPRPRFY
jgi:hypothetical protein